MQKTPIRIEPNDAEAHYNLGLVYKDKGNNNKQAITHLKEFIRLAETNPNLQDDVRRVRGLIIELYRGR